MASLRLVAAIGVPRHGRVKPPPTSRDARVLDRKIAVRCRRVSTLLSAASGDCRFFQAAAVTVGGMRTDHPHETTCPAWYDPEGNFSDTRFAFALRVGHQAATVSSNDWQRVEAALQAVWVVLHEGLTWEQARPAVYHGWLSVKRGERA